VTSAFERILAAPLVESFESLFLLSLNPTIAATSLRNWLRNRRSGAPTLSDSYLQGVRIPTSLPTPFKFLCESELLHDLEHLLTLFCREIRTEGGRNRDNRGYKRSRGPGLFDRCGFGPRRHPSARVDGHENFIALSHCIEGSVQHNDFCCKAGDN
jgi:hypothetical protein